MTQSAPKAPTLHTYHAWQLNSRVGDLIGNAVTAQDILRPLRNCKVPTIVIFSEMMLTGYSLQDLVQVNGFNRQAMDVLENLIAPFTGGNLATIMGLSWRQDGKTYNASVFCADGKIQHVFTKTELPNDSVFDEVRNYKSGAPSIFTWKGIMYGVPICEDVWHDRVCLELKRLGAQIILSPNASPYDMGKWERRKKVLTDRVTQTGLPLLYLNRWGGQDELVFDGQSAILLPDGTIHRAAMYKDACITFSFDGEKVSDVQISEPFVQMEKYEEMWQHILVGIRDYVGRHGEGKAVLGLSGGIDSALVACLLADALGPEQVNGYGLPSDFSSPGSVTDSSNLAKGIGIRFKVINIESAVNAQRDMAEEDEGLRPEGVTDENLQARTRGQFLMGRSNAGKGMVISTGNKSEMCVGYATMYGDMNGGFNPIKDLYKMEVHALAAWRAGVYAQAGNHTAAAALKTINEKQPSAELKPGQLDSNNLPVYPVLDPILYAIIEELKIPQEITVEGASFDTVLKVYWLTRGAVFKWRQACPGVRIHRVDLDKDKRMPLDNGYDPMAYEKYMAAQAAA